MGHLAADGDNTYVQLQQRLDRMLTGAPDSLAFRSILRLLFSPEEAELAVAMPPLCSMSDLSRRLGRDEQELDALVSGMARRGLVLDYRHRSRRWIQLAPVVLGFFEFVFMRVREDLPMERLAGLFDEYLDDGPDHAFAHAVWRGSVQVGRSLIREEALPADGPTEVLDWERATEIVASARHVAVSLCSCRHKARLLGKGCDAPLRTCLTFDGFAEALGRAEIAEPITNDEALDILVEAKAAGLAQVADNVQRGIAYMCNCCGCCCGMVQAIRQAGITDAIVSSNYIAETDLDLCRGCKLCFRACPVDAITMVDNEGQGPRRYWAIVDEDRCLGCGVCFPVCRWGGRVMAPRAPRIFTPATRIEQETAMAVERGKLGDYLVDVSDGLGPRGLSRVLKVLEETEPGEAQRAIAPLRSVYLQRFLEALQGHAQVLDN